MSVFGVSLADSSDDYFKGLAANVEYEGKKYLEETMANIEQKEAEKMVSAGATTSKTAFIAIGVAGALLITLAILKKKKII